jgi:large subunit ribosomal protein L25
MQATHTLNVERRPKIGSRYAQRARANGKLPCVLYGHGKPPVHLNLEMKEAVRFFHSGERVFTIELTSENVTQTVLLKDLQFGYLGDDIVHCDLMRVDLDEVVESKVSLHFFGEPAAMKGLAGASVAHPVSDLPIRCKVKALPDAIRVDVSGLTPDAPITAGMLELPEGVELDMDPATIVVVIAFAAEVASTEAEAVGGDAASPEVLTEKKDKDKES